LARRRYAEEAARPAATPGAMRSWTGRRRTGRCARCGTAGPVGTGLGS